MVGERFGRLVIISESIDDKYRRMCECVCDCGNKKLVRYSHMKDGKISSCKCYQKQVFSAITSTHGLSKHPLYKLWKCIISRCYYKGNTSYIYYGARGIKMCDEWLNSFESFYLWCSNNGWQPGLEIDRKENSKDYFPDNCRFITPFLNSRNKRSNLWITFNGETKILKDWALFFNINYQLLHKHISYRGITFVEALKRQKAIS